MEITEDVYYLASHVDSSVRVGYDASAGGKAMTGPIVQLLQGMIHNSESDFHRIQDFVHSLPPNNHLHHALRNLQHSELLRLNMLRTVLAEVTGMPA